LTTYCYKWSWLTIAELSIRHWHIELNGIKYCCVHTFVNLEFHVEWSTAKVSDDEFPVSISLYVRQCDALGECVQGGNWVLVGIQPFCWLYLPGKQKRSWFFSRWKQISSLSCKILITSLFEILLEKQNKRAQRALERSPETKDFKFSFFIALSTTGET